MDRNERWCDSMYVVLTRLDFACMILCYVFVRGYVRAHTTNKRQVFMFGMERHHWLRHWWDYGGRWSRHSMDGPSPQLKSKRKNSAKSNCKAGGDPYVALANDSNGSGWCLYGYAFLVYRFIVGVPAISTVAGAVGDVANALVVRGCGCRCHKPRTPCCCVQRNRGKTCEGQTRHDGHAAPTTVDKLAAFRLVVQQVPGK